MSYLTLQDLKTSILGRDRLLISSLSLESLGTQVATMATAGAGGNTIWPGANLAIYVPFQIARSMMVQKMWVVAAAVGTDHIDMGIYKENGTKLVSMGDTAAANANTGQELDITNTLLVGPGRYYMALSCNGVTFAPFRANIASVPVIQALGPMQQATAFVLPSPATFAVNTSFATLPLFGISGRTLVA